MHLIEEKGSIPISLHNIVDSGVQADIIKAKLPDFYQKKMLFDLKSMVQISIIIECSKQNFRI